MDEDPYELLYSYYLLQKRNAHNTLPENNRTPMHCNSKPQNMHSLLVCGEE